MKVYYTRRVPSTCVDQSWSYLNGGAVKRKDISNITEIFNPRTDIKLYVIFNMLYICARVKVMFTEYLAIPRSNKRISTEGWFMMNVTSLGTGYCINSATPNYKMQRHTRPTNNTPFYTNTLTSVRILTLSFPSQVTLVSAGIYFKFWQCLFS